jgi:hypothetical protein
MVTRGTASLEDIGVITEGLMLVFHSITIIKEGVMLRGKLVRDLIHFECR